MNSPPVVAEPAALPAHSVQVMSGRTVGEIYLICRNCPDGGTGLGLSYMHPRDRVFELQTGTGLSSMRQLLDWVGGHQDQDPEVPPMPVSGAAERLVAASLGLAPRRAPELIQGPSIGQLSYAGYCESSRGLSLVSGAQLPLWVGLAEPIRAAWEAAADAVADYLEDQHEASCG